MKNKKIILITGANKGLGKEIGRQLGKKGYTLVLTSRNAVAGKLVIDEFSALGLDAHLVTMDVTNQSDIEKLVKYIQVTFGKLDILVNNAGISLEWDGNPTTVDKIRRTLDVNLLAPYALTQALTSLLSASDDARVINHSSMLGSISTIEKDWDFVSDFASVGYSTSKAGLNMLTVIQSKTLKDKGIFVAAAHPGWVKTDLGTQEAPLEVEEGASTVVELVTMDRALFPHGQLIHRGNRLPW
jgi:NAD(P)-dependent dehydrogenase (short-subunit alcohol dehydrogenase family)